MSKSSGLYITVICLVLAVTAIGVGYAMGLTSTFEVEDNTLTDETIVVTPGGESSYSGSFSKEVEFHLGTRIVDGQREVVYSPCSWYIQVVEGVECYNLGSIHLEVDGPSSPANLTLTMKTENAYTMQQEFKYMVLADVSGRTALKDFDMDEGSTFVFGSTDAKEIISKGVDLTLYMKVKTLDYLPSMILDDTVFYFTASVD